MVASRKRPRKQKYKLVLSQEDREKFGVSHSYNFGYTNEEDKMTGPLISSADYEEQEMVPFSLVELINAKKESLIKSFEVKTKTSENQWNVRHLPCIILHVSKTKWEKRIPEDVDKRNAEKVEVAYNYSKCDHACVGTSSDTLTLDDCNKFIMTGPFKNLQDDMTNTLEALQFKAQDFDLLRQNFEGEIHQIIQNYESKLHNQVVENREIANENKRLSLENHKLNGIVTSKSKECMVCANTVLSVTNYCVCSWLMCNRCVQILYSERNTRAFACPQCKKDMNPESCGVYRKALVRPFVHDFDEASENALNNVSNRVEMSSLQMRSVSASVDEEIQAAVNRLTRESRGMITNAVSVANVANVANVADNVTDLTVEDFIL